MSDDNKTDEMSGLEKIGWQLLGRFGGLIAVMILATLVSLLIR